jgi:hypothetical protein
MLVARVARLAGMLRILRVLRLLGILRVLRLPRMLGLRVLAGLSREVVMPLGRELPRTLGYGLYLRELVFERNAGGGGPAAVGQRQQRYYR